jgi:hypothetical protein
MTTKRWTKLIAWILSIAIPLVYLGHGLLINPRFHKTGMLLHISIEMALKFAGVWMLYFFATWLMKDKRSIKQIIWKLSAILPFIFLLSFLINDVLFRPHMPSLNLQWALIHMFGMFAVPRLFFLFFTWPLAKRKFDGSELTKKQATVRVMVVITAAIVYVISIPLTLYVFLYWVLRPLALFIEIT